MQSNESHKGESLDMPGQASDNASIATLAGYFVHDLKTKLATALAAHCSLATMQELDVVISAAEEMEAKLNLAAKQDQPSLAAVTGGYGAAKKPRGNTAGGGRSPYARGGRQCLQCWQRQQW